jgi:hypothetical protein
MADVIYDLKRSEYGFRRHTDSKYALFIDDTNQISAQPIEDKSPIRITHLTYILSKFKAAFETNKGEYEDKIIKICRSAIGVYTSVSGIDLALMDLKESDAPISAILHNNRSTTTPKTESKMSSSNMLSGMNLNFGKLSTDKLAYSFAGVAVKKNDGTYVVYDKANKKLIEVGDLKIDTEFYQIPVQTVQEGDLIKIDDQFLIVDKINADQTIRCISPTTGSTVNKLSRTNLFNMYFYTKIVSMFDMMNGGMFGQPQVAGGQPAFNPMMFMLMGSKDSSMSSMMEIMMMSQMFGGTNPFAGFNTNNGTPNPQ